MATKGRAGGKKTGGRKAGVPNKVTASMRQAWQDAFDSLGGVPALVKWGRAEPTEFYKLASFFAHTPTEFSGIVLKVHLSAPLATS